MFQDDKIQGIMGSSLESRYRVYGGLDKVSGLRGFRVSDSGV